MTVRAPIRTLLIVSCLILLTGNIVSAEGMAEAFRKQAEQGDATAQYNLGAFYYLGVEVSRDYEQARDWLTRAAEQEFPLAQGLLGIMYLKGQGVPRDYQKARDLLEQAAQQGDTIAQVALGGMYYTGEGIEKDNRKAYQWTLLAAATNNVEAKKLLQTLHREMTTEQIEAAEDAARKWLHQRRETEDSTR